MSRVKALFARAYSHVPSFVKKDGTHVVLVFLAAFVGTAQPLLPSLVHSPDFKTAKAAAAAAVVAGLKAGERAARPVAVALAVKVAYKIVAKVEANKAAVPSAGPTPSSPAVVVAPVPPVPPQA